MYTCAPTYKYTRENSYVEAEKKLVKVTLVLSNKRASTKVAGSYKCRSRHNIYAHVHKHDKRLQNNATVAITGSCKEADQSVTK